jgi:hypothetical protein
LDALADAANVDPELAALQKILAELGDELELAFTSHPERNSPEDERLRYIYALTAISKFLHRATASTVPSKRFYELAIGLNDLEFGRIDSLFKPPSGATSASPTRVSCGRAKVAVIVNAYVCAGWTREQAAERTADKLGSEIDRLASFERRQEGSSRKSSEYKRALSSRAKKALNWYDQFKKPNSKLDPVARQIFELGSSIAPLGPIT